jgi:hypothetical protein
MIMSYTTDTRNCPPAFIIAAKKQVIEIYQSKDPCSYPIEEINTFILSQKRRIPVLIIKTRMVHAETPWTNPNLLIRLSISVTQ